MNLIHLKDTWQCHLKRERPGWSVANHFTFRASRKGFDSDDLQASSYFSNFMLLCCLPLKIRFYGQSGAMRILVEPFSFLMF